MIIKELEKLIEFLNDNKTTALKDVREQAVEFVEDITRNFVISQTELLILSILKSKLRQEYRETFFYPVAGLIYPKNFGMMDIEDYTREVKHAIYKIENSRKQAETEFDKLIWDYQKITKKVEEALKQSNELRDIAKKYCDGLKGYI